MNTLIAGGTIVGSGSEIQADILIEDGVVRELGQGLEQGSENVIDASGLLIFPGLIDCHVHFREPGMEHKETMATGAAAALAGGVTTVCEMPNTKPPMVTVAALADKVRRAAEQPCDIRFFFGATELAHLHTLRELWTGSSEELQKLKRHCSGLKLYFDHSTGNQKADHEVIEEAFAMCAGLQIPIVGHCEDAEINRRSPERPPESEMKAIEEAIFLAKKHGTQFHVAHLSTKQGLELIREAKKSGANVTCEVAPHHLFLTVDDYEKLGTLGKMNPPLRTREHQEALWEGIADGTVDCIATDHAPHTLEEKRAGNAPSGVPGVETMLSLLLTVAAGHWPHPSGELPTDNYQLSTTDIIRLCFSNPNRIFNLGKRGIAEGAPADLILVDPRKEWVIRGKELHSKCRWTPYEEWKVVGKVRVGCRP